MNGKRFRLRTLMIAVVIAALVAALVGQQYRAALREAEAQARIAELEVRVAFMTAQNQRMQQIVKTASQLERAARDYADPAAK